MAEGNLNVLWDDLSRAVGWVGAAVTGKEPNRELTDAEINAAILKAAGGDLNKARQSQDRYQAEIARQRAAADKAADGSNASWKWAAGGAVVIVGLWGLAAVFVSAKAKG